MSVNVNILLEVNKFLTKRAKQNDRDYSYFHASSWDTCHRQTAYQYYEAIGLIKIDESAWKIDPRMERVFETGHFMHDRWRLYLTQTGALRGQWKCLNKFAHQKPKIYGIDNKFGCLKPDKCECGADNFEYCEVGFSDPETMWGGHVDGIIDSRIWPGIVFDEDRKPVPNSTDLSDEQALIIIDFKTMNSFAYGKLTRPKSEHITQLQIYMYLSGLKQGKLLYENKDNQAVKEFLVIRDDAFIAVKIAEAKIMKQRVEGFNERGKKELPPRGFDSNDNMFCKSCRFRGDCWKKRK